MWKPMERPEPLKLKVLEVGPKFVKLTDGNGPILWERKDPFTEEDKFEVQGMVAGRVLLAQGNYELKDGKSVRFLNGDDIVFHAMPPTSAANVTFCRESNIMPLCDECPHQPCSEEG
jgi:hypothetical protein